MVAIFGDFGKSQAWGGLKITKFLRKSAEPLWVDAWRSVTSAPTLVGVFGATQALKLGRPGSVWA